MIQQNEVDKVLKSLTEELKEKHHCHTVLLYGSHARGNATEKSDFDLLGLVESGDFYRIGKDFEGVLLDAFIYSEEGLPPASELLRLDSAKVLLDEKGLGKKLLEAVREEAKKPVQTLPGWEKELRKTWIKKMYDRSLLGDVEGNYRRHWLLFDLLENWFDLNGIRFQGSKRAFEFLKKNRPEVYLLFQEALKPGSGNASLESLLKEFP